MEIQAVNPASVPKKVLASGVEIPVIGMGTFGSDRFSPDQVAEAVAGGIRCGYRLFDCAACYGNEKEIGQVFRADLRRGNCEKKRPFHYDEGLERYARACGRGLPQKPGRSSVHLGRSVFYPLAFPKLPRSRM